MLSKLIANPTFWHHRVQQKGEQRRRKRRRWRNPEKPSWQMYSNSQDFRGWRVSRRAGPDGSRKAGLPQNGGAPALVQSAANHARNKGLWATWSGGRCPYPWQGVGLDDLQRSLPAQAIISFYETLYRLKFPVGWSVETVFLILALKEWVTTGQSLPINTKSIYLELRDFNFKDVQFSYHCKYYHLSTITCLFSWLFYYSEKVTQRCLKSMFTFKG